MPQIWTRQFDGYRRFALTTARGICYALDFSSMTGIRISKSGLQMVVLNAEKKQLKLTTLVYWEKYLWRIT